MRHLTKIVLTETSGSADEHAAVPDEGGSYGELVDAIDGFIEQALTGERQESAVGRDPDSGHGDHESSGLREAAGKDGGEA